MVAVRFKSPHRQLVIPVILPATAPLATTAGLAGCVVRVATEPSPRVFAASHVQAANVPTAISTASQA